MPLSSIGEPILYLAKPGWPSRPTRYGGCMLRMCWSRLVAELFNNLDVADVGV